MPQLPALDVASLTFDLVRVPSLTGSEGDVVGTVETFLRQREWAVRRIPVSTGRDDLLATASDAPTVTLSTHLDTVPPYLPRASREVASTGEARATPKALPRP